MDGYSVQDAASVLGVPEGRVWELLARGVLSGAPEGDSMRVFLKADAPPARPAVREAVRAGNGNGGSHEGEGSAFRELLTEFRNLTERYGQALLALGEARGEVAGLRSRVELLEARIDLRLPSRLDAEPVSWAAPVPRPPAPQAPAPEAPAPEAPAPEPPAPAEVEAVLPTPAPVERTPRPRKSRTSRAAVAGFAEALARAQDPNQGPVRQVIASAEAVGAAPPEPGPESPDLEVAPEAIPEPGPMLAAEAEAEQPAEATYRAAEVEPDWFADGDFSWLDAADLESRSRPVPIAVEAAAAPAIEEPISQREIEAAPQPAAPPAPARPEAMPEAEPQPIADAYLRELVPEAQPQVEVEPEAPVIGEMEPVAMSGAGEEAVMWLGEPAEAGEEVAAAQAATARSYPGPNLAPRIREALEPVTWPATDRAAVATEAAPPPLAMTEAELAQLARDEGWDDAEVAAIRAMISRPSTATVELPGSAELEEAISALQAVPVAPRAEPAPGSQWAKPTTREEEPPATDDWAFQVEPSPPAPVVAQPALAPRRAADDPDWLRRRRGPAAEAYRRIRRIFTG